MLEDTKAVIEELFTNMKDRTNELVTRAQRNTEQRVKQEMTEELNLL